MKGVHETEKLQNVNDSRNRIRLSPHLFLYFSCIKKWKCFKLSYFCFKPPNPPFTNTCKSQCAQSFSLSPNEGLPDPYCLFFKTSILISPQDRSWHVELMNSQERQEGSAHLDVRSLTNWPKVFLHVRFVSLWENDDEIAIRSADSCR